MAAGRNESCVAAGRESIVSLAVAIEEQGAGFYDALAERTQDKDVAQLLRRLADDERQHARAFGKLLEGGNMGTVEPAVWDYIRSVVGSENGPGSFDAEIPVPDGFREAIQLGIQAEKDSILFYQELYEKVDSGEVRETLSRILKSEKLHLMELRSLLEENG